ncbi:uncharacterized protein RJT21DRAFT_47830 [Scheffersomyces amazonensis]|uniref:uncharacterized protein n=1 Tax=Scheffersomyces amazonensis TaxID=1078765 RepID=UPI00315C6127
MSTKSIFVIGATGFIGLQIALALRHAGFIVYGLARSDEKIGILLKNEIIPILHTSNDVNYLEKVAKLGVTHVIDLSGTPVSTPAIAAKLVEINKSNKVKIGLVYTSGLWVHGNDPINEVDETHTGADENVAELIRWRPTLEKKLLAYKDELPVIVVRPGLLFGYNSPIWAVFFKDLVEEIVKNGKGEVYIPVKKDLKTGFIHVTDVADFFLKVIEKFELFNSSVHKLAIFDIISETIEVAPFLEKAAKDLGFKGSINFAGPPPGNKFIEAFNTSFVASSKRARSHFNWEPKSLISRDIGLYARSWAAANNKDYVNFYAKL